MAKEKRSIKGFRAFIGRINTVSGKKINQNKGGFTLIEVLVVVLIIGILTSIALPQYQRAVAKAKLTEAIQVLKALGDAEQVYYDTYNRYATNLEELDVTPPAGFRNNWDNFHASTPSGILHIEAKAPFLPSFVYIVFSGDRVYCSHCCEARANKLCQKFYGDTTPYPDPTNSAYEMIRVE